MDLQRDLEPDWFQRADMAGYVFYIDRFAGNLRGVLDHLDCLDDLGITYVHFMPCLKPRPGDRRRLFGDGLPQYKPPVRWTISSGFNRCASVASALY